MESTLDSLRPLIIKGSIEWWNIQEDDVKKAVTQLMNKEEIISHLQKDVYVRLGRSEISGVGVIAIKDIPKGTDPFKNSDDPEYIGIAREEMGELNPAVERLMKDLCVFEEGQYWLPETGLNSVTPGWYLNHSKTPNMIATKHGEMFETSRDITAGEELTVDYSTYDESGEF